MSQTIQSNAVQTSENYFLPYKDYASQLAGVSHNCPDVSVTSRVDYYIIAQPNNLSLTYDTIQVHASIMDGLREVLAKAVGLRRNNHSATCNTDVWNSSNLALNTRPRIKRGGGM